MKPQAIVIAFVVGLGLGALGAADHFAAKSADGSGEHRTAAAAPASPVSFGSQAGQTCPTEAQLRRIVREELAAATATMVAAQGSAPATRPVDAPPAPAASAAEVQRVNQLVDQYIQAGVISDSEMARLQDEIATLDPTARRAAMQRLVRALNSGALDGRL